jgi:ribosomal protein S18 acetylase RimI-like enzyme
VIHSTIPLEIRAFADTDELAVIELWRQCNVTRPWSDPHKDIQRKRLVQPHLFLVGVLERALVSTVMAGYEGHRGWINYLAVAPEYQHRVIGQRMMAEVERLLREAGCPKINVQVPLTNQDVIQFYRELGYTVDDVISLGKRLEADS